MRLNARTATVVSTRIAEIARLLFLAFLLAALLPNDLKPQTTTSGALAGVVTDPSQAVVPERSAGSETVGMTSWTMS